MADQVMDLPWVAEGMKYKGLKEIPGPKHNATILMWLKKLHAWWSDDETPWCGVFVAYLMQTCGFALPKLWMQAKAWGDWGTRLAAPVPGCLVVFTRVGGGHVGIVLGTTPAGELVVLGGNQGDAVSIARFGKDRQATAVYCYPPGLPVPDQKLQLMSASGEVSTKEA